MPNNFALEFLDLLLNKEFGYHISFSKGDFHSYADPCISREYVLGYSI
jgi:hypothetical protein